MPVTAAAVHLPAHRLTGKEAEAAGFSSGSEVRVPWWDEDALTLAVEAALGLGDAVERAAAVHIAFDEQHPRPELATLALGLAPHPFLRAGPRADEDALVAARDGPALVMGARAGPGGWGAAVLVERGPAGTARDLLTLARATRGVRGLDAPAVDTTAEAWRKLTGTRFPAWADASQGAYVSDDEYDADPAKRYGARGYGAAVVEAVTTVASGPPGEFLRQHEAAGPYDVAIVQLARGGRAIGQVAGAPGRLAVGARVEPVLRRLFSLEGRWRYAVKWKPTGT